MYPASHFKVAVTTINECLFPAFWPHGMNQVKRKMLAMIDSDTWVEALISCMMNADREAAQSLVNKALEHGFTTDGIINSILEPALKIVGTLWGERQVTMAQAYVGAKISEDILLRCLPDGKLSAIMEPKGIVVIGNIEDDYHSLGRRMISTFLQASGWIVHDLGNDVLAEDFVNTACEVGAHIVGASAMMHTTALNIRKIRDLIDKRNLSHTIKLAVGGAVFNWRPELVKEVGGDGTAGNAAAVDGLFIDLLAQATQRTSV